MRSAHIAGLSLLALVFWTGCVSLKPAPQTPGSEAAALEGVPATRFGAENCGAASLAAVLAYWDVEVSIEELDQTLPKADNGGVLSLDLLLAARERGFRAQLVVGDRAVLRENLEAGRPLILMLRVLNAIGERRDLYHYVVVDGFDPGEDLVRVQYGDGTKRWVGFDRLSRAWEDTDFTTLVLEPGAAGHDAEDAIRYAVALEEEGRLEAAAGVYHRQLGIDPDSVLAWVNLGNVQAARGLRSEAEDAYRKALELDPEEVDALNNLAWLLLESGKDFEQAEELAQRAVNLAGPDPYLALDTLGRIELERGRCDKAVDAFRSALESAPEGSAAADQVRQGLALAQRRCESAQR